MDDDREVPSGIAVVNALEDCMIANDHSPLLRVADGGGKWHSSHPAVVDLLRSQSTLGVSEVVDLEICSFGFEVVLEDFSMVLHVLMLFSSKVQEVSVVS